MGSTDIESWHEHPTTITLTCMPQQTYIRDLSDDWTGQSNQFERKKRQNRINQRQHRKRKEALLQQTQISSNESSCLPHTISRSATKNSAPRSTPTTTDTGPWQDFSNAISTKFPPTARSRLVTVARTPTFVLTSRNPSQMIQQFQLWAASRADPAADHVLILIKFNIFRACTLNAFILGIAVEAALSEDAISHFTPPSSPSPNPAPTYPPISLIPESLRPTAVQKSIEHHPWIDILPVPRMRDNLILAGESYDESALCEDLCGYCGDTDKKSGLIVWDSPWEARGWELTPEFLGKWAWVVEGCGELMEATNYWRGKRGEKALSFGAFGLCR